MNVLVIDVGGTHVKILAHWPKTTSGISIGPEANPQTDGRWRQEACQGLEV